MKGLRILHAFGALLTAAAIDSLLHGYTRAPIAMLCLATLIQFASLEALRVSAATTERKVNP